MKQSDAHRQFPWARLHALNYPVKLDALQEVLDSIASSSAADRGDDSRPPETRLVGASRETQLVRQLIDKVAPSMATVLITGASGTGKEVIARRIHELSGREGPFVAVNCGAIPEHLLESELFGHERGAFTGAASARVGRFEQADGGTFFLDEIGDMPPAMQVKLLRVLEDRSVERVGGGRRIAVDVRMIAATHRDLPQHIRDASFREDLFYRLNVFPIEVAPLRQRVADIQPLVDEFASRLRRSHGVNLRFEPDAMRRLEEYDWPGNVRELSNVIERVCVTCPGGVVTAADLPPPLAAPQAARPEVVGFVDEADAVELSPDGVDLKRLLADIERELIVRALDDAGGVIKHAAKELGVARTTLVEKLRKFRIARSD